jgi:hypothetical protein
LGIPALDRANSLIGQSRGTTSLVRLAKFGHGMNRQGLRQDGGLYLQRSGDHEDAVATSANAQEGSNTPPIWAIVGGAGETSQDTVSCPRRLSFIRLDITAGLRTTIKVGAPLGPPQGSGLLGTSTRRLDPRDGLGAHCLQGLLYVLFVCGV